MIDLRQTSSWGQYLKAIGWKVVKINNCQIFIKIIPLVNYSIIKIQHPPLPVPFQEIDQIARQNNALFVLIEPEAGSDDLLFKKNGFFSSRMLQTHTATIRINLKQSLPKILASFSENARRNIKKAQGHHLEIKIIPLDSSASLSYFREFFQLFTTLTKLKNFYTPSFEEFSKKMIAFKNQSVLLFAYFKNQPVACLWLGFSKCAAHYMHTGITKPGYQLLANYLLVWEAVKLAQQKKLTYFDFEGIYDPRFPQERKKWQNFSEFKKRFHGELIEYPTPQIKFYSKLFKIIYLWGTIFTR